jgi:hypothetical protein
VPEGDDLWSETSATGPQTASSSFYYGDVGFWNGVVRIGEFNGEMDAIERQSDDFSVTIERAERRIAGIIWRRASAWSPSLRRSSTLSYLVRAENIPVADAVCKGIDHAQSTAR